MFSTSLEETLIIDMCFSKIGKSSQILNICLICKQTLKSSCVIPSQSVALNLIPKNGF